MIRRTFLSLSMILPAGAAFGQLGGSSDLFGAKQIVRAVMEGDEEKVRQALLKHESPNQTANNGQPLLIVATRAGHVPVVETLLKGGAQPDAVDLEGYSALMRASEKGDVDIVEILLRRNASTRTQNRQGQTALMIAAGRGYAEIVKLLLDKKADPNSRDFTGRTALTYAKQANRGSIEAALRRAGGKE
jgi:ankyrin repeat protein